MKAHFKIIFVILLIIGTVSCSNIDKELYKIPENAIQLLSGGKLGKSWKIAWRYNDRVRMNMSGCFLSYRITYRPDMTMKDNSEDQENCGSSLTADWEIITDKKGNHIMNYPEAEPSRYQNNVS